MRAYSDMATRRLEEVARKLGVECQIRTVESQEDGRYFVVSMDQEPLKQPVALGFTVDRAVHTLNAGSWQRYALRGEPTRLVARKHSPQRSKPAARPQLASW